MRVAIITSSLPPVPVGGAESQAWHTARRLAGRGHEVVVFARRLLGRMPTVERRDEVTWVRSPTPSLRGLSFPGHLGRFLRDWRRHRGDSEVILAYQTVISGVLGGLAASDRIPLVTWIRSQQEFRFDESRKYRLFTPWVLGRSTIVLTQTEGLRRQLESALRARGGTDAPTGDIRVLGNALEPGPEPTWDGRSGIVYVGRLWPVKGVEVLLEALRRIPDPPPLTICGDGPLRSTLEDAARGLPVTFAGRVSQEEIPARVAGARLIVAPSWSEGFPNAVLEGMERGIPAVATRVGGIPDVVRDGREGWLVEPGDAGAMAARIRELLEDDATWLTMARDARRRALDFAWASHLERLEGILADAVAAPRRF